MVQNGHNTHLSETLLLSGKRWSVSILLRKSIATFHSTKHPPQPLPVQLANSRAASLSQAARPLNSSSTLQSIFVFWLLIHLYMFIFCLCKQQVAVWPDMFTTAGSRSTRVLHKCCSGPLKKMKWSLEDSFFWTLVLYKFIYFWYNWLFRKNR